MWLVIGDTSNYPPTTIHQLMSAELKPDMIHSVKQKTACEN